jgi:uncharacterized BrkB/YihY/UPF0761 family membrane protein
MIWMWMSAIIFLFGAELNSEIEHQTAADSALMTNPPPVLKNEARRRTGRLVLSARP